jgi:hypothetical protein
MHLFGRSLWVVILGLALLSLGCKDVAVAPTALSYSSNPAVYDVGVAIPANSPMHSGSAIDAYAVSPALPGGLSLDTKSGVISGTPTAAAAVASYTVTATNSAGSTTVSLSITVNGRAITITSEPLDQAVVVGQTATFSVTATGSGTLSYQWLKDGTAISGATTASYATPPVVLTDSGSLFSVQVSDAFGGSAKSTSAALTVLAAGGGPGTFIATGSLASRRGFHTATRLLGGKVLIVGGYDAQFTLANAELFDPAMGTFASTGSLVTPRMSHTATLLADGKVLICGGVNLGATLASAELYDPATGTFTATGSLATVRSDHTATLLGNGKVLIVSGRNLAAYVPSAELFDPATGTFTTTANAPLASRATHTATLLGNGKVLLAGGFRSASLATAEVYDPASGTFTGTGSLAVARANQTATLLPSGRVLVVGGAASVVTELYDPAVGAFAATGSLTTARALWHSATLLPTGQLLIAGGRGNGSPAPLLSAAELYDPALGTFAPTGTMTTARELHTATPLLNGKVLLAGGEGFGYLASAEIYY